MTGVKMNTILKQLFLVVNCCLLHCAMQPETFTVHIEGTVFDKSTKLPLKGISVKQYKEVPTEFMQHSKYDNIGTVTTNDSGFYELDFTVNISETYMVCAFGPGDDRLLIYCTSCTCCKGIRYDDGFAGTNQKRKWDYYIEEQVL